MVDDHRRIEYRYGTDRSGQMTDPERIRLLEEEKARRERYSQPPPKENFRKVLSKKPEKNSDKEDSKETKKPEAALQPEDSKEKEVDKEDKSHQAAKIRKKQYQLAGQQRAKQLQAQFDQLKKQK